jgi:hypothetical protein
MRRACDAQRQRVRTFWRSRFGLSAISPCPSWSKASAAGRRPTVMEVSQIFVAHAFTEKATIKIGNVMQVQQGRLIGLLLDQSAEAQP